MYLDLADSVFTLLNNYLTSVQLADLFCIIHFVELYQLRRETLRVRFLNFLPSCSLHLARCSHWACTCRQEKCWLPECKMQAEILL